MKYPNKEDRPVVYFDNAATTFPKPESVPYEIYRCLRETGGNPGRGTNRLAMAASESVYLARQEIADFFSSDRPENVIFTYNATYAINLAIKCFVPRGSKVLISDLEHNAVYRPVVALSMKGMLSYDIFRTYGGNEELLLKDLSRRIDRKTTAIICTGASNICNIRLPIREIGRIAAEHRLLFILDASQLAGHAPINQKEDGISILCAPTHKGLYGPQGGGFLIAGDGVLPKSTLIEGGSGYRSKDLFMPETLPEMLEAGTIATPVAVGVREGIRYLKKAGMDAVQRYEARIADKMRDVFSCFPDLSLHGDAGAGSVFSVTDRNISVEELSDALEDRGICVRAGFHCAPLAHKTLGTYEEGTVRFSCGIFTTDNDMDALYRALCDICGTRQYPVRSHPQNAL